MLFLGSWLDILFIVNVDSDFKEIIQLLLGKDRIANLDSSSARSADQNVTKDR